MATGYSITTRQVITAALRKLGVLIQGEAATSTQESEAILALNAMLKRFFTLGMPFYREYTHSITTLVSGTAAYAVSPDSVAPLGSLYNIYQAYLRNTTDNIDVPLMIISREEYNELTDKSSQGQPTQITISADGKTVYLYQTPDATSASTYDVYIFGYKENETITAATDTISFPQEWYESIIYGLAVRLGPEYGSNADKMREIKAMADNALADAVAFSPQEFSIYFGVNTNGNF